MDSETSSVASFRMDRTPATPDEDQDEVRARRVCFSWRRREKVWVCLCIFSSVVAGKKHLHCHHHPHPRVSRMRSQSCVSASWPGSTRPCSEPMPCCRNRREAYWMPRWKPRYRHGTARRSFGFSSFRPILQFWFEKKKDGYTQDLYLLQHCKCQFNTRS